MAKKKPLKSAELALKHLSNFVSSPGDEEPKECIPTGHFCLDFAINYGYDPTKVDLNSIDNYDPEKPLGLPVGKLVEFYGEEGGGKSSLAYRVCGNAQRMGHTVVWLDAECSYSKSLAEINGCDPANVVRYDSSVNNMSAEQALELIEDLCIVEEFPHVVNGKKKMFSRPKVIVIDSLAALVPAEVMVGDMEQQHVGLLARLLSAKIGRVTQAIASGEVLLIIVNQLREKVGMMFGNPETTPGGHAIKHMFSVRLSMTKINSKDAQIKIKDEETGVEKIIGSHSKIRIKKNRFGAPVFDPLEIPIYYEKYFPDIEEVAFNTGRQLKMISVYLSTYSWKDLKVEGKKAFIEELKKQSLVPQLISDIKATAAELKVIIPPELLLYQSDSGDDDAKGLGEQVPDNGTGKDSKTRKKKSTKSRRTTSS